MFTRTLGKSGLQVSAMGLGCMAIGRWWTYLGAQARFGKVNDDESTRAIHQALDLGVNFFDTAANYGAGHSERILGRAIAGRRDKVVIATKFGHQVDEETRNITHYGDEVASHVREDCEASLRRLGVDYIDLYQFHVADYDPIKAASVRDVLEELVVEGKIRVYGWSTNAPERISAFVQGEHCVAIQHTLNVVFDAPEMLAVCNEFDQASIARSPLGLGLLTGKYNTDSTFLKDDWRQSDYFQSEWIIPILGGLNAVRDILTSGGRTLAQGALAWIWARSERTIPIPGFRTAAQVEENARAMEFGPLDEGQVRQIDELLGRDSVLNAFW